MRDLDKTAMGKRVRQIRLGAGLRQWELARILGTTQSAVHKYEHGVVPEPRRLIELARTGGTSVEWILTGRHWEDGSETQARVSPELLETAHHLRELSAEERTRLDEALRIVRDALGSIDGADDGQEPERDPAALVGQLADLGPETLRVLESAHRIQRAVLRRIAEHASERLDGEVSSRRPPRQAAPPPAEDERATRRRR